MLSAGGCGDGESSRSAVGPGSQRAGGRQIVVTRDSGTSLAPCRPAAVGRFLEQLTVGLRERNRTVLRRAWGRGFRGMSIGDQRSSRRIVISSYQEGMRRLKGRRLDLRFDTVMVGARGRDLLFVGKRFDRQRGERFFGKGGLRCTRPIGIRMLGVVTASARTIGSLGVSCPAPATAVRPQQAMVVCTRGGRW